MFLIKILCVAFSLVVERRLPKSKTPGSNPRKVAPLSFLLFFFLEKRKAEQKRKPNRDLNSDCWSQNPTY